MLYIFIIPERLAEEKKTDSSPWQLCGKRAAYTDASSDTKQRGMTLEEATSPLGSSGARVKQEPTLEQQSFYSSEYSTPATKTVTQGQKSPHSPDNANQQLTLERFTFPINVKPKKVSPGQRTSTHDRIAAALNVQAGENQPSEIVNVQGQPSDVSSLRNPNLRNLMVGGGNQQQSCGVFNTVNVQTGKNQPSNVSSLRNPNLHNLMFGGGNQQQSCGVFNVVQQPDYGLEQESSPYRNFTEAGYSNADNLMFGVEKQEENHATFNMNPESNLEQQTSSRHDFPAAGKSHPHSLTFPGVNQEGNYSALNVTQESNPDLEQQTPPHCDLAAAGNSSQQEATPQGEKPRKNSNIAKTSAGEA